MLISIIGLGFVGNAIHQSYIKKGVDLVVYDKFKNIGSLEPCLKSDIMFLALPTVYDYKLGEYDKQPIIDTCEYLTEQSYGGLIVIKSTVEPQTTEKLSSRFPTLNFVHNPEFLKAKTAEEDFHNQTHIVLGKSESCKQELFDKLCEFYSHYYPDATISKCSSTESEMMKIFVNSFYSVKIQFFTELYLTCEKTGTSFDAIKNMMLANDQIHESFTHVPGHDGQISYGGLCFPKDTNALNKFMEKNEIPNAILSACVKERNNMRKDHDNCNL
jgi:UDPglucose 6-dehydrogenase